MPGPHPSAPGTSPISAPLHAAEPSRSPSAAAPNPLPKLAPCPAHPKPRCPAHASVPVSPRPRQHSCPAPLSARISTGATSNVPSLLQPHVPPHPSAPGWGQRTGTGLSTGTGAVQLWGAQLGDPKSRSEPVPSERSTPPRVAQPCPQLGPLHKLPGSGQNSFPSKLLARPQTLLLLLRLQLLRIWVRAVSHGHRG